MLDKARYGDGFSPDRVVLARSATALGRQVTVHQRLISLTGDERQEAEPVTVAEGRRYVRDAGELPVEEVDGVLRWEGATRLVAPPVPPERFSEAARELG